MAILIMKWKHCVSHSKRNKYMSHLHPLSTVSRLFIFLPNQCRITTSLKWQKWRRSKQRSLERTRLFEYSVRKSPAYVLEMLSNCQINYDTIDRRRKNSKEKNTDEHFDRWIYFSTFIHCWIIVRNISFISLNIEFNWWIIIKWRIIERFDSFISTSL